MPLAARRGDGLGRDRLQRSAQAVGVSRLVLREQPAQQLAQAFVDQMDLGEIPGRIADFESEPDGDIGSAPRSGGPR